ncbi:MAG: D-glycero-beta-D-manno-heptose-7-phosphate kinase [Desulfarculus sp.]|nr:D-glycero-beta-D-manno-heptose-7-phosphate kinase [Desulfarculus sp.]
MTLNLDVKKLTKAVGRFRKARVLVLGDVMLDQFVWGSVRRISPEAPVPVVEVQSETYMLGGAANVLHNLIALGGRASLCGLVGDDQAGRQVAELLDDLDVSTEGILVCKDRPTTVKTRVVAHGQQVVRVDRESRGAVERRDLNRLRLHLERQVQEVDAVIVSDYAKGVISGRLLEPLMALARAGRMIVTVDPKVANIQHYAGATVITPNHLEAAEAARVAIEDGDYVQKAGRQLLKKLEVRSVLVTQGERGMTLFSQDGETHIPTTAKQVYDVTGAGDTVISTLTLGLVAGLDPVEAAVLANFAAGVVVGEVGTSAVTAGRLIQAVETGVRALAERPH